MLASFNRKELNMSDENAKEDRGISPAALGALLQGDVGNFVVASTPGGIEAQEKEGQQMLVNSELLPIDMGGCYRPGAPMAEELLKSFGCEFGDPSEDGLFISVQLPTGWKKVINPYHNMWSYLVDEENRWRASIFYKAAFYDRQAHLRLEPRIVLEEKYPEHNAQKQIYKVSIIADRKARKETREIASVDDKIYTATTLFRVQDDLLASLKVEDKYRAMDVVKHAVVAWAEKNYPDCLDPGAYWDVEL